MRNSRSIACADLKQVAGGLRPQYAVPVRHRQAVCRFRPSNVELADAAQRSQIRQVPAEVRVYGFRREHHARGSLTSGR